MEILRRILRNRLLLVVVFMVLVVVAGYVFGFYDFGGLNEVEGADDAGVLNEEEGREEIDDAYFLEEELLDELF